MQYTDRQKVELNGSIHQEKNSVELKTIFLIPVIMYKKK